MKKINSRRNNLNKKGDVALYFVVFGVIIFAISLIIYMIKMEGELQKVGENTIKIINTFESSERISFYLDASAELAANYAQKSVIDTSGYLEEIFKGRVQNHGCGILSYPIIDSAKQINECFPEYDEEFKIKFTRKLNSLVIKYDPQEIDANKITTKINKLGGDINVQLSASPDLNMPIYAYIESYYRDADRTKTSNEDTHDIKLNAEGYFTEKEYKILNSFSRQGSAPTKIVIHDTMTSTVDETFMELQTGLKNYNYVIEKNGDIYVFAPEDKYTLGSGCTKVQISSCVIEGTDKESVSIALVNERSSPSHTSAQILSLHKLVADISLRNPSIDVTKSIILNREIETSRINDPAKDIVKQQVLDEAQKIIVNVNAAAKQQTVGSSQSVSNSLTGNAVSTPNIDESKCFNGIRTTVYFTSDYADYNIWSTNAQPCQTSLGYCCIKESNRGFYEEVKCQGSGVYNGALYHSDSIQKSGPDQSIPLEGHKTGRTSRGKDPVRKRTIAADPDCPGFNYDSKLYIYWGDGNPWNGYYVVEDTGPRFKGVCNAIDVYAGVGKNELNDALKYVGENAKVCVLDSNFEMPDPDFSGSSSFIDPTTGGYNIRYAHEVSAKNISKLFDNTKSFLEKAISSCRTVSGASNKEACVANLMNSAKANDLSVEFCDKTSKNKIWRMPDIKSDMPLVVTTFKKDYRVLGTVKKVVGDNQNLFQNMLPQQAQGGTRPSLISSFIQKPSSATITITDELGEEMEIKLNGTALDWVDYYNKDSALYESDSFIRPGDKLLLNITRIFTGSVDDYYVDKFDRISEYPEDILKEEIIKLAKTIAECATSSTDCACTTDASSILGVVNMTGNELIYAKNDELRITVPFSTSQSFLIDTSSKQTLNIYSNVVEYSSQGTLLPQCTPEKRYLYICSSLTDDKELGTIGFTLKI